MNPNVIVWCLGRMIHEKKPEAKYLVTLSLLNIFYFYHSRQAKRISLGSAKQFFLFVGKLRTSLP
jgi:hypothetical protein